MLCSVTIVRFCTVGDVQYSEKLHKVFIRFEASCPFLFSSTRATPRGCVIRATPTFVRPQHVNEVVRRCPHHTAMSASSAGDGGPPADHLIRCEHKLAKYQQDSVTGFHSVVVPYDGQLGTLQPFVISICCAILLPYFTSTLCPKKRPPFFIFLAIDVKFSQDLTPQQ